MNQLTVCSVDISHTFGEHECEACQGQTEDNLHENFTHCTKHPDHALFIPITVFTIEHLPEHYRDNDVFEFIKVVAELTVRIAVEKVSPNRPEFWPDTKKEYPFYKDKGKTFLRTGTGEIDLFMYKDGHGFHPNGSSYNSFTGTSYEAPFKTCPCEKCQQSEKPSNVWLEIQIHTAAHVVFDKIEAQHTSCRLFFDESRCPKVTFEKVDLEGVDFQRDKCYLKYILCDMTIGKRLHDAAGKKDLLWSQVLDKFETDKLTFIVSHPHGCEKQVSIGEWTEHIKVREYNEDFDMTKLIYTTCTCSGSSGARAYCVGIINSHVHNGVLTSGLNYSSVDVFRK